MIASGDSVLHAARGLVLKAAVAASAGAFLVFGIGS